MPVVVLILIRYDYRKTDERPGGLSFGGVVKVMRGYGLYLFVLLFGLSPVPAQIPVHEEPFHQPVYHNGTMRILRVALAPGDTSLFHRHSHNIFYATLKGTRMWLQTAKGESREVTLSDGWTGENTSYARRPFVHRIANVGQDSLVLFAVESLRPLLYPTRKTPDGDSVFYTRGYHLAAGEEIKLDISGAVALIALKGLGEIRTKGREVRLFGGKQPWYVPESAAFGSIRNTGSGRLFFVKIRLSKPLQ